MGASLQLPGGIKTLNPQPEVTRYYNSSGTPYANIAEVLSQVVSVARYVGQLFLIGTEEYWFNPTTADTDLKVKLPANLVTGVGTPNYIAKWGSTSTIANSLIYDNGINVLIGSLTDNNVDKLQITGSLIATSIKKLGGTVLQFLKADGSIDSTLYENSANKQNSMIIDGTGTKFPTVDAVNAQSNNIARALMATGFLDTTDSFQLFRVDDYTLGISDSQYGIAFSQRFKQAPFAPSDGVVNLTARNIPLSAIGLTGTGTAVKFVGYRHSDDSIQFSDTQFIQSPSVCQLGIVLVKWDAGVTSFIDANRTTITIPDVAAYSNLDTSSTGVRATATIAAVNGTLSHSNAAGKLVGISVGWGTSNNDVQLIAASNLTSFTRLYPGNALTVTPPATFTTMDPTVYWNGTALVSPGNKNSATVQRLLFTVHGNFVWQYGELGYSSLVNAQNNILQAPFTDVLPQGTFAEIGRMAITQGCNDLASGSAQYYPTSAGGGGGGTATGPTTWGTIIGSLNDQLDLKAALDSKVSLSLPETITGQKTFSPTISAASNLARGTYFNPSLTATANNDTLVALDINPVFNNGSFTSVGNIGLRAYGQSFFITPSVPKTGVMIQSMANNPFLGFAQSGSSLRFSIDVNGGAQESVNFTSTVSLGNFNWFNNNTNQILKLFSTGNMLLQNGGTFTDNTTDRLQVTGSILATSNIKATGLSTSWGTTSGISTGGLNVAMGTSSSATWLISGTSGGTFRSGIQSLDSDGTLRFYQGSSYMSFNNGGLTLQGTLTSTVATGTAPLSVSSTSLNTNLNADMVDGLHASSFVRTDTALGALNTLPKYGATGLVPSNISENASNNIVVINGLITGSVTKVLPSGNTSIGQSFNLTSTDATAGLINRTTFTFNEDGISTSFTGSDLIVASNKTTDQPGGYFTGTQSRVTQNGSGIIGTIASYRGIIGGTGTGTVANVSFYDCGTGPFTLPYSITTFTGLNLGYTPQTNVTNSFGVRIGELYGTSLSRAIEANVSAGTGKYNIAAIGTAINYFRGNTLFGTTTDSLAQVTIGGTVNASSNLARGAYINNTLVATANNDVLIGLNIAPTFNIGSFTGVTSIAARINGRTDITGSSQVLIRFSNTAGTVPWGQITSDITNGFAINSQTGSILLSAGNIDAMKIFAATGNVSIQNGGTFTDNGIDRLQVGGTVIASGYKVSGTTGFLKSDGTVDTNNYQTIITNPVTGTGTANTLSKWTAANTQSNSNVTDTGTAIILGATTQTGTIQVNGLSTFKGTTASDSAALGAEILTTGSGTNWTGTSFSSGYTHTVGSTVALTESSVAVVGNQYWINITISTRTAGSISVSYGGVLYTATMTVTEARAFKAIATTGLVITPTTDFDGTIVVSTKLIGIASANIRFSDSAGNPISELRGSGSPNLFFGYLSGSMMLNNLQNGGSYNVGFGLGTLRYITQGRFNTAIGAWSLGNASSTSNNTALGYNTLFNTTTGSNNTAIGTGAMQNNTTGGNITAVGNSALFNNTIGANNTVLGGNTLVNNISGSNNVAIGFSAGQQNNDNSNTTISNNSILIGYDARTLADNQTNQIVIGYTGRGLGNNTTVLGNSSTITTAIYGNLILGTTTNNGVDRLQIVGSTFTTSGLKYGYGINLGGTDLNNALTAGFFAGNNLVNSPDGILASYFYITIESWNPSTYVHQTATTLGVNNTPNRIYSRVRNNGVWGTWAELLTTSNGGVTGTGTANYVSKWSSTSGLVNSIIYDNGTNILIGTTTDNGKDKLQVNGSGLFSGLSYTQAIDITSQDLNNISNAGFYTGQNLSNAPAIGGFFYITVERYAAASSFVHQVATSFGAGGGNAPNRMFTRVMQGYNTDSTPNWTDWSELLTSSSGEIGGSGTTNYISKFTSGNTIGNSLIYDDGTKVGIGTNTPNRALEIKSGANEQLVLTSDTVIAGMFLYPSNATFTPFIGATGNDLIFNTVGAEVLRVTGTGNIGIGTSTPNTKLEINGITRISGASTILQLHSTNGTPQNWWVGQDANGLGDGTFYIYNSTSGTHAFDILKNGNVGIGITNPTSKLHIKGSGELFSMQQNADTDTNYQSWYKGDGITRRGYFGFASPGFNTLTLNNDHSDGDIQINTVGGVYRSIFKANGNLLIGTTTDNGYKLQVNGDTYINGSILNNGVINLYSDSTTQFVIHTATNTSKQLLFGYNLSGDYASIQSLEQSVGYKNLALNQDGGSVLVGTTINNGNKLQVNGIIYSSNGHIIDGAADGSTSYILYKNNGANLAIIGSEQTIYGTSSTNFGTYVYSGADYFVSAGNAKRLIIKGTGNVLIGTNTDNGTDILQVNGTSYFAGAINIAAFQPILLSAGDPNHGIKYSRYKKDGSTLNDGPFIYGFSGGSLGTSNGSTLTDVLGWNSFGRVLIGLNYYTDNGLDKLQVGGTIIGSGYKIPGGTGSQYLMADGSVSTGSSGIDVTALHKTGNESFTGTKSSTATSGDIFDLFNNGSGDAISVVNNSSGIALDINNLGSGYGIYMINDSSTATNMQIYNSTANNNSNFINTASAGINSAAIYGEVNSNSLMNYCIQGSVLGTRGKVLQAWSQTTTDSIIWASNDGAQAASAVIYAKHNNGSGIQIDSVGSYNADSLVINHNTSSLGNAIRYNDGTSDKAWLNDGGQWTAQKYTVQGGVGTSAMMANGTYQTLNCSTYSPTISLPSGLSNATSVYATYQVGGNVVSATVGFTMDATTATSQYNVTVSFPFNRATTSQIIIGSAVIFGTSQQGVGRVISTSVSNCTLTFNKTSASADTFTTVVTFQYYLSS